jgi:transposase
MQTPLNIGVDVAKKELVVACAANTFITHSIANRRAELRTWLKSLPQGSRIGLESTGTYHELLADLAYQQGFSVFVLNPRDTRHYAKGVGARAKTDRVDAQIIARYLAREYLQLHPYQPPTADQRRIDQLLRRRAKLSTIRAMLRQSLNDLDRCGPEIKAVFAKFDALIKKIDLTLARLSAACPERFQTQQHLQSIIGVGPIVGISLSNLLQRIAFRNADAFVAFLGYDTRPEDSGQKRGRRRLSKRGPGELRRLLFNAAMSASKCEPWNPIYRHYRDKGLSGTAALCIIARKIARTAWSISKHKTLFDPKRLTCQP